jgi:hypothetical protein
VEPVDAQENLRYLLNQWDPIGVADIVIDEYDCMIAPLVSMLSAGAGRAEIGEFLWYELDEHFGLSGRFRKFFGGGSGVSGRVVQIESASAVESFFGTAAGEPGRQDLVLVAITAGQVQPETPVPGRAAIP